MKVLNWGILERELHILELDLARTKNGIIPVLSIEEIQLNTQQVTVKKLPISGKGGRFELLKQMNACFVFCGNNAQQQWPNKKPYSLCGSEKHHVLLCKSEKVKTDPKTEFHTYVEGAGLALYAVQQAKVC